MVRKLRLRPLRIRRTGDDTPARSLYRYVWRMSGWHQAWLSLLAVVGLGILVIIYGVINPSLASEQAIDVALWTSAARVLMNTDEFVCRE